jgi:hypothetical protein
MGRPEREGLQHRPAKLLQGAQILGGMAQCTFCVISCGCVYDEDENEGDEDEVDAPTMIKP